MICIQDLCVLNVQIFFSATQKPSIPDLRNMFNLSVTSNILMRSTIFETKPESSKKPNYNLELDLTAIHSVLQGQNADLRDSKIYWKVNFDRLIEHLR